MLLVISFSNEILICPMAKSGRFQIWYLHIFNTSFELHFLENSGVCFKFLKYCCFQRRIFGNQWCITHRNCIIRDIPWSLILKHQIFFRVIYIENICRYFCEANCIIQSQNFNHDEKQKFRTQIVWLWPNYCCNAIYMVSKVDSTWFSWNSFNEFARLAVQSLDSLSYFSMWFKNICVKSIEQQLFSLLNILLKIFCFHKIFHTSLCLNEKFPSYWGCPF